MPEFKKSIVTASRLLADDRFNLGGHMYQISEVTKNPDDNLHMNIGFHPVSQPNRHLHNLLIVPWDQEFKIYNQK